MVHLEVSTTDMSAVVPVEVEALTLGKRDEDGAFPVRDEDTILPL